MRVHACIQLISFNDLLEKLVGSRKQQQGLFKPLRRSCQREILFLLTPYRRGAALIPTPSVRAERTCTTMAIGVFKWAMGVWLVSEKERSQEEQWYRVRGTPHFMV